MLHLNRRLVVANPRRFLACSAAAFFVAGVAIALVMILPKSPPPNPQPLEISTAGRPQDGPPPRRGDGRNP